MNYRTMAQGALALSLSLIVGSSWASTTTYDDAQSYGATFEGAVNTTAGEKNDYAYVADTPVTNYYTLNNGAFDYGWMSGSDEDESKIVSVGSTNQVLQLNTDAATLTNKFSSSVASTINDTLSGDNGATKGTVYFETDVKFVASDTPDANITGGTDATKFAIYAYANEDVEPATTNLVVYHAYYDAGDASLSENYGIGYTNEVFEGVTIDTSVYTKLRVEMKQISVDGQPFNLFNVSVNGGAPLTSELAYEGTSWLLTTESLVNEGETSQNQEVGSLNFKGTGEIDNISVGVIESTTTYAIDWTDSVGVVVSNNNAQLTTDQTNFLADAVLTFYPIEGTITNINGVAQDPGLASYEYTVDTADTNLVVLAGAAPVTPTYAISWTVDNVVVSNTTDSAAIVEAAAGSYPADTVFTFYPTEGSITNVTINGSPVADPASPYVFTVVDSAAELIVKASTASSERVKPAWAADADTDKFWTWVDLYSVDYSNDYTAQYLMNVDPSKTPVLKIDSIVVTAEGSQIVVSANDGTDAINLANINGILNVSVGSTVSDLTSKAIPGANKGVPAEGKVSVIIKTADGAFAKATVDFLAAETSLQAVSQ